MLSFRDHRQFKHVILVNASGTPPVTPVTQMHIKVLCEKQVFSASAIGIGTNFTYWDDTCLAFCSTDAEKRRGCVCCSDLTGAQPTRPGYSVRSRGKKPRPRFTCQGTEPRGRLLPHEGQELVLRLLQGNLALLHSLGEARLQNRAGTRCRETRCPRNAPGKARPRGSEQGPGLAFTVIPTDQKSAFLPFFSIVKHHTCSTCCQ